MFPFSVYKAPSGLFSVATSTAILCHNASEATARELVAKAFPDFPLIDQAFETPSDVLTWRATWQQAVAHTLDTLNDAVDGLAEATGEELDSIRRDVATLNAVTAEQSREQRRAALFRELAVEEARVIRQHNAALNAILSPTTPKHIRDQYTLVSPASARITEIKRELGQR